ncbi:E1 ubiquitin-activating protein uba2 [Agyrium rufum]|nr:E1 ubiquitin-activating protein uba2 [Agyrium rufum]
MITGRDSRPRQALGVLHTKIKQSRILLVGAGGIGCELLKNLVLTGFGEIHIVDLDTIDLSNLNRQFLFRHEHIKKSKALVAKETASKFNRNVKLEAYHANIKDTEFSIAWFQGFDLVFNALDNLDARRHVNRMCLAADVPLVESGTTGFSGQVQVIRKGRTECYDCNTKEIPKTFPVCTIRSTPSQFIHCIVWAKSYLFAEIFGTSEDQVLDTNEDEDNAEEIANLQHEAQALQHIRESMGSEDFGRKIFDKVFKDDIERLRGMEDMWKSRKPPEPLSFEAHQEEAASMNPTVAKEDQLVWNFQQNLKVFLDRYCVWNRYPRIELTFRSLDRLSSRLKALQKQVNANDNATPILTFDKDDEDTLDFVAASANLRSIVFGIEAKSKFDIKQMAGNIIPAIATTNAMTAGLCVLQAFKVLGENLGHARMVFLERSGARIVNSEPLRPPNPQCSVCSVAHCELVVDTNRATLGDLVDGVLKTQLGYGEELTVNNDVGTLYDPELDDNLTKRFADLGLKDQSFLTVIDDDDDGKLNRVNLSLSITQKSLPSEQPAIYLPTKPEISRRARYTNGAIPEEATKVNTSNGEKRRLDTDDATEASIRPKKRIMSGTNGTADDLVVVDDEGQGEIVIDD